MFPGMGGRGMDPKQMAGLMRQMGIKTTDVDAKRVVVERQDGSKLVIASPTVTIMEMQGQKSLQVAGEFVEGDAGGESDVETESIPSDDASLVMKETGAGRETAEKALEDNGGDIAAAILSLQK
ncbi:Nascent polypeptide-associated complex protein [Candidatus Micrarchaeota archaeon]|nr:Nascent polypeptide-associated complex protein [Candidatus Micrarchaeota archaeon]